MVFDDSEPVFDESAFRTCDWSEFYPDAEEAIPHNAPEARGNGVVTSTLWMRILLDARQCGVCTWEFSVM